MNLAWRRGNPTELCAGSWSDRIRKIEGTEHLDCVLTNGCFTAFHGGHLLMLREAAKIQSTFGLIVLFNSAESIKRLKGHTNVIPDELRGVMLSSLSFVQMVILQTEDTPIDLLKAIKPRVLVKGGATKEVVGEDIVKTYGGEVIRLPYFNHPSTTEILGEVANEGCVSR